MFKVVSKPFKTEYENEYGGGRLAKDPRNRESQKRWYIPKYNTVSSRVVDHSQTSGMTFVRKRGKITGAIKRANFNRFKRIPHPLLDGEVEEEHLAPMYTEEDINSFNKDSRSVEMKRPNSSRPDYNGTLAKASAVGYQAVSKSGCYQRVFPKQNQRPVHNNVYTIPFKGGGNILTRKSPYQNKQTW